jgi:hypothetical protein
MRDRAQSGFMNRPIATWKSLGPARQLRTVGAFVLICGCGGAALFHWWARTRAHVPTPEELLPGYQHARDRQRAILMGGFVAGLMESLDALREPDTQAIILAIISVVLAVGCFWIASMVESRHVAPER